MEFYKIDKYLDYPKNIAYDMFLDERNLRLLKRVIYFIIGFFVIYALVFIFEENLPAGIILPFIGLNIIFLLGVLINYKKLNVNNIRRFLFIFLGLQLIFITTGDFSNYIFKTENVIKSGLPQTNKLKNKNDSLKSGNDSVNSSNDSVKSGKDSVTTAQDSTLSQKDSLSEVSPSEDKGEKTKKKNENDLNLTIGTADSNEYFSDIIIFLAILILIFRFTRNEYLLLYSIAIFIPVLLDITLFGGIDSSNAIPNIFFAVLFCFISVMSERKRYNKFTAEYDYVMKKNVDTLRMKRELNTAKEIQLSMLPENKFENENIQIAGLSVPASEVGGDYYDYFVIDENKTGLFICDVSGHGVASGLTLSGIRSCLHLIMEETTEPKVIMEKLNKMLRKTQSKKMFVTAIFATIDFNKNKCEIFNAGHLPPYKISGETGEIFKFKKHNITLGATDNFINSDESIVSFEFKKGDKIVFYTDGVNEAMNTSKREFGFERIEKILNDNYDKSVSEILDTLFNEVKKFSNEYEQKDDITILITGRK
ncbi:MAG: SpoIIE family protein phosphatase [Ignavibacteria bacterium]|nr:SpoIIE family protein phosphatase [Ignavibacteria bacterium]